MNLAELRLALVYAKGHLVNAKYSLALFKAKGEQKAADGVGGEKGLGPNAESRERYLTLYLHHDSEYQGFLNETRDLEYEVARLEALIENEIDARRERELDVRSRLVAVLERRDTLDLTGGIG